MGREGRKGLPVPSWATLGATGNPQGCPGFGFALWWSVTFHAATASCVLGLPGASTSF